MHAFFTGAEPFMPADITGIVRTQKRCPDFRGSMIAEQAMCDSNRCPHYRTSTTFRGYHLPEVIRMELFPGGIWTLTRTWKTSLIASSPGAVRFEDDSAKLSATDRKC